MAGWARPHHAVTASIAVVTAAIALAAPGLASALPAGCALAGTTATCRYTTAGETQFTVPAGVTSVSATVVGAHGGSDFGGGTPGGLGAVAGGTVTVTPGEPLDLEVGILGGAAGMLIVGFADSGAGGGESDVRTCPAVGACASGTTLASRLLVAGGGGGSGDFGGPPGNAGTTGDAGNGAGGAGGRSNGAGGHGATTSGPGTGGAGCDGGGAGSDGAAGGGAGGAAGAANGRDGVSGGGGGAGWFGGGAGGGCSNPNDSAGSGGGGTSHADASVTGASFAQAAVGQAPSATLVFTVFGVTTASLPDGGVGAAYSQSVAANNRGTMPYHWSISAGALPTGLHLSDDGTISGAPQAAGPFGFTVQVTDSSTPTPLVGTADLSITVGKTNTTTQLTADPVAGVATGDPVTMTAAVASTAGGGPAPGGTVDFTANGSPVCSGVSLSAGTANCATSTLAPGPYAFNATYSGDANYVTSSDQVPNYGVTTAVPGVSLSASPPSGATVHDPVTLVADLSAHGSAPTPTGTVTFTVDGSTPAGCVDVAVAAGSASCAAGTLAAGAHTLEASYAGNGSYRAQSDSLVDYEVAKLTSAVAVTSDVAAPVWGQGVSFVAHVTAGGTPATAGTVQWSVGGTPVGTPVALSVDGAAALGPLSDLLVGSEQVTAVYSGTDQNAAASGQADLVVAKAATATTLSVGAQSLSATVTAVAPGAGQPSGTVAFAVNGAPVGDASLSAAGVATLAFASSGGESVSAVYGGSDTFTASSASASTPTVPPPPSAPPARSIVNPTIAARLSSAHAKSGHGWYRRPVTVSFTCAVGSAPLDGPCPSPVTLSAAGVARTVTRTIHATDSGIATATSPAVDIDLAAPTVRVSGVRSGAVYDAPGPPRVRCAAHDALSGLVGACRLTVRRAPGAISWTASATDRAGNTATTRGHGRLIDFYVAGAQRARGAFQVTIGRSYVVKAFVHSTTAPRFVFAAPRGAPPQPVGPPMSRIGHDLWAVRVHITRKMRHHRVWRFGVVRGRNVHTITIELHR